MAFALGIWAAGCGSPPKVEPPPPAATPALQRVEEDAPFIVDWDARQAASLANALRTPNAGAVVVAYQRNVIRVLPDCHLAGAYVPSGIGMYRGMLQVRRFDAPVRSAATRQDALQQIATSTNVPAGAPLDYRFVVVGRHYLSGHPPDATLKDVTSRTAGGCRDATHFVRAALTGAFEHTVTPTPGAPPPGDNGLVLRGGDFTPCVMAGTASSAACSAFLKIELTALLPPPDPSTAPPPATATAATTAATTAAPATTATPTTTAMPKMAPQIATTKIATPLPTPTVTAAPTTAPQIAVPKPPPPQPTSSPAPQPTSPPAPAPAPTATP